MPERPAVHDPATTVQAGGIAPLDAALAPGDDAGSVSARTYENPALPGRVVVRLEADAIAAAADAEMDVLGFQAPRITPDLGRMRHRTVGFPGWAILHDPDHARFALEVTREFKKAAKRAASKPGHAKDDFDAIAARLSRSVPHFLPSYWEEVGRVFLGCDAWQYASQAFERARQAEMQYSLPVDEKARGAAFLEFALAGAVSAKSLSAYAKELEKTSGAARAHAHYRQLAVKRTLGGMPPWAGMGKELRALARSAGLEPAADDEQLVAELIDAPALGRAPADFWKTYRPALLALGRRHASVRKRLLEVFPSPGASWRGVSEDVARAHFDLLDECGALAKLADPGCPTGEMPSEGLTAWTGRAIAYLGTCDRARGLLSLLAPRLVELGEPVSLVVTRGWRRSLSLDLCEAALELGLAVAAPRNHERVFGFEGCACDPVRTAADSHLGPLLVESVGQSFGDAAFETAAAGKKGFAAARRAWLEGQVSAVESGLIVDADEALDELEHRTTARTFGEFPDLLARLESCRAGSLLARTLRVGLVDELTWPAYEKAIVDLGGTVTLDGAFPWLVVRSAARAIVVGARGRLLEHDLAYDPKAEEPTRTYYLDRALLVVVRSKADYDFQGYWSGEPGRRFEVSGYFCYGGGLQHLNATDLGDRGTCMGGRAIRAGDTAIDHPRRHLSDGSTLWVHLFDAGAWQLRELDPATGKTGRASRPTFLEQVAGDPDGLDQLAWIVPAPPELDSSPLGMRDRLLGMRMRSADGRVVVEMIDGSRWEGPEVHGRTAIHGIMRFPADGTPRLLARDSHRRGTTGTASVWTTGGRCVARCGDDGFSGAGWGPAPVPPAEFWHFLVARDTVASAALRQVEDRVGEELVATARSMMEARGAKLEDLSELVAASARLLPEVTNPALGRAVASAAVRAAGIATRLASITAGREPRAGATAPELSAPALALQRLLDALVPPGTGADWPSLDWFEWLTHPRARTLLLLSPLSTDSDRRDEVSLVKVLVSSPLLAEPAKLRYLQGGLDDLRKLVGSADPCGSVRAWSEHGNHYVGKFDWRSARVVERSPAGRFVTPEGMEVVQEIRFEPDDLRPFLARCVEVIEAHGEAWDDELPERLAEAAGITRAEASLLWTGAPGVASWSKDFLGSTGRAKLGLKVAEADAARGPFREMPRDVLLSLLEAAAPGDPACLASPTTPDPTGTSAAGRVGAAWRARFGTTVPVPEELLVACEKELGAPIPASELFRMVLDPGSSPLLKSPELVRDMRAWLSGPHRAAQGFDGRVVVASALVIPYLALSTPAGDPVASRVPAFHEALSRLLDDPALLMSLGFRYTATKDRSDLVQFLDTIGGERIEPPPGVEQDARAVDNGLLVATLSGHSVHVAFRPSRVDASTLPVLRSLAGTVYGDPSSVAAIAYLRSQRCRSVAQRLGAGLAAGAFDANPLASVPELVARVAGTCSVTREAAALYLQLLALPEPTARAVQRWNGWTAAAYQGACAELVAKKLLVEGKRERAGRDAFLPGEWLKGTGKNLPTEGWKLALYEGPGGDLPRRLPPEPMPALFERAWHRVESGDGPKYEEVR